jgi:hypothetical protein
MNKAEQMRDNAQVNQVHLINTAIETAVKKGKFDCEGDGHLTQVTLDKVRADGFRVCNDTVGFKKFWWVRWV